MLKALGRCKRRHYAVIEVIDDGQTVPAGDCKVCGDPLIEWAVK